MVDAPERIWARYIRTQEGRWVGQHAAQETSNPSSTEYVRADLYEELKTKVEVAAKALEDIMVDPTWGLEHETYMRCRAALRQLKEDN